MTATSSRVAYRFPSFERLPLRHALSGRAPDAPAGGDVGYTPQVPDADVAANRRAFMADAGIELAALTLGRQTHGAAVAVVERADRGRGQPPDFDGFPSTDGLVTMDPAVALGVIVADCVPLLLYDARRHALGIVHAGWRGTVAGIARVAVQTMVDAFTSRPEDLLVGLGPSIGPCCYEVGAAVIDAWTAAGVAESGRAVETHGASYHFNLWMANRLSLQQAGVPRRNIETSALCTRCESQRFFSYRAARQGIASSGRMLMVAQLSAVG